MLDKNPNRLRRARQTRLKIREIGAVRLTVYRTNGHIYAQITSPGGDKVLASASSAEKEMRASLKNGGNRKAAEAIGQRIAQKAKAAGRSKENYLKDVDLPQYAKYNGYKDRFKDNAAAAYDDAR